MRKERINTKNEEHELEKMRAQLEEQPILENALDEAIFAGFHKARSKHKRKRRSIWLSTVAVIFLISFATSVRVSPTFANAMASIPGLNTIVEMLQWDKGLKDIVENEYFEELNIETIKDDITFTLLGVIADESGMVITYRIEASFDLQKTDTKRITIYQNGKELEVAYGYNLFPNEPTYQLENQVEITAPNPLNYDSPNFEFQLIMDNPEQTTFNIPFTLKKEIQKSLTYPIEQTIEIDGQKASQKVYFREAFLILKQVVLYLDPLCHLFKMPNSSQQLKMDEPKKPKILKRGMPSTIGLMFVVLIRLEPINKEEAIIAMIPLSTI